MKNTSIMAAALFALAAVTVVGCGGTPYSIAPVSGKVTCEGEPVADLRLVFTPIPDKEANTDPGPWSTGVTNAQGEYTLETRYGKNGASVGESNVSFEWNDSGGDLEMLEEDLSAAIDDEDKEEADKLKKQIADLKERRKNGPKISESTNYVFTVPKGGTNQANFDLKK